MLSFQTCDSNGISTFSTITFEIDSNSTQVYSDFLFLKLEELMYERLKHNSTTINNFRKKGLCRATYCSCDLMWSLVTVANLNFQM